MCEDGLWGKCVGAAWEMLTALGKVWVALKGVETT